MSRGGPTITFRPLDRWPGESTPGSDRRVAQFSASRESTMHLLGYETGRLGARAVAVQLAISEEDFRADGQPKIRAAFRHPGVVVSFDSEHGPLRYSTDRFTTWIGNLRAIALGLEALRTVDRYGIGRGGEQYRGYRQLQTGADDEATVERGRALIREAGSVAAALHATHPDRGGNPTDLRSVLMARDAGAA
jgi:hypothetical protein